MQEIALRLGFYTRIKKFIPTKTMLPEHTEYSYCRLDGTPFLVLYFLTASVDSKISYPKLVEKRYSKFLEPVQADGQFIRKGKRIDWSQINLKDLFVQTKGRAKPIAEALGVA